MSGFVPNQVLAEVGAIPVPGLSPTRPHLLVPAEAGVTFHLVSSKQG